jgi:hypothetical protein
MNLKEIKDAARQAFRDQQTQDTEGGVPDAVSFITGFLEGARHVDKTHLDNFKEMLVSMGYTPELEVADNKTMITLSSDGHKVHGYLGFVARFEFKEDGSLDNVGIYE